MLAWVTGIAGVAVLGAGVVFFVLDGGASADAERAPAPAGAALRPVVGPGIVAAEVVWRF